jgi:hypothetical protein
MKTFLVVLALVVACAAPVSAEWGSQPDPNELWLAQLPVLKPAPPAPFPGDDGILVNPNPNSDYYPPPPPPPAGFAPYERNQK